MRFLSIEELAEFLGVPRTWIYERTRKKGPEMIPHIKLGKYIRFNPESPAFQKWLNSHEKVAPLGNAPNDGCNPLNKLGI